MKTEYLRYFLVASEAASISKAAEQLHLSQQGLSRIIGILEREYGVILFSRTGSKSKLTPAGKELQSYARAVVDEYERLERSMHGYLDASTKEKSRLTLYMTLNSMHHIYPCISDAVNAAFPAYAICAIEIDQREVIPRISDCSDEQTLFFVSVPLPILCEYAEDDGIDFRPLINARIDVMVARNSSLSKSTSFNWKDLEKINFIIRRDNGMIELLKKKHIKGYPEKAGLWTSDTKTLETTLESSDTATFSTSFLAEYPQTDRFVHIPLENTYQTPVGFIGRKDIGLSEEAISLRSFIESYIAKTYPKVLFTDYSLVARRWRPVCTQRSLAFE